MEDVHFHTKSPPPAYIEVEGPPSYEELFPSDLGDNSDDDGNRNAPEVPQTAQHEQVAIVKPELKPTGNPIHGEKKRIGLDFKPARNALRRETQGAESSFIPTRNTLHGDKQRADSDFTPAHNPHTSAEDDTDENTADGKYRVSDETTLPSISSNHQIKKRCIRRSIKHGIIRKLKQNRREDMQLGLRHRYKRHKRMCYSICKWWCKLCLVVALFVPNVFVSVFIRKPFQRRTL